MNSQGYTDKQKQALLDLVVMGTYADHNLKLSEDASVQRLLDTFQFTSDYLRQQFSDDSYARARRHTDSPEAIQAYLTHLAENFTTSEERQNAYALLVDLVISDGRVAPEESQLLAMVKTALQL